MTAIESSIVTAIGVAVTVLILDNIYSPKFPPEASFECYTEVDTFAKQGFLPAQKALSDAFLTDEECSHVSEMSYSHQERVQKEFERGTIAEIKKQYQPR